MSDDVSDIAAYYNSNPLREDTRLERHQLEHELTWRYFERYLPPCGCILEVGAATGRYTMELARRGYQVTAVDLSAGLLQECRQRIANDWIEDRADVRSLLARGHRPDDYPPGGFRGYFVTASEIAPLHEAVGFETLAVAGVEPAISADDESYNRLAGNQRQLWLELLYEISTEISSIGASRHLLYVGRKKP